MGPTSLFLYLKIILLQCFQFLAIKVCLNATYFAEIILMKVFKCINSNVRLIFNESFVEKRYL